MARIIKPTPTNLRKVTRPCLLNQNLSTRLGCRRYSSRLTGCFGNVARYSARLRAFASRLDLRRVAKLAYKFSAFGRPPDFFTIPVTRLQLSFQNLPHY